MRFVYFLIKNRSEKICRYILLVGFGSKELPNGSLSSQKQTSYAKTAFGT
jgi:hypothetical protein